MRYTPAIMLAAVASLAAASNTTISERDCTTCDPATGGQKCEVDTWKAKPYVRFIVSNTDGKGDKTVVLDIKDCGTEGLKNGLQWHQTMDPVKNKGPNNMCQSFIMWKLPWYQPPRWSLQVSDSKTWAAWDVDGDKYYTPRFMPFDPVWLDEQHFTFVNCDSCDDEKYLGKNCLIRSTHSQKCLQAYNLKADNPEMWGNLNAVDCNNGNPTAFNLQLWTGVTDQDHTFKFINQPKQPDGY